MKISQLLFDISYPKILFLNNYYYEIFQGKRQINNNFCEQKKTQKER